MSKVIFRSEGKLDGHLHQNGRYRTIADDRLSQSGRFEEIEL